MAVTLKEVAERAGVSRSAVSRTFTKGASVSVAMRRKVEEAAQALGYQPNALASSLTTGRTRLIGLVSDNFHNPTFLQVYDLFTRGLQDRGYRPLLVNLSGERAPENSVRMLRQYSVDGVVVASSTLAPDFATAFHRAGVPVVHAFGRAGNAAGVPVIGIDNVACGRMAATTLAARGYRSVGFLGGPAGATSTQDRMAGFLTAMQGFPGIRVSHSFASDYSFQAGRAEMLRLIESGPAEAYFCGDDILSIGALSALSDSGLVVPGDVGVIGVNDMELAGWACFALTTIRQPFARIVRASIDQMAAMLEDPEPAPGGQVFDCEIVERGTLRPVP